MGIYAKKLNKDKIHRGQKSSSHLSDCNYKSVADSCNQTPETEDEVLARAQIFIQWLTNFSLGTNIVNFTSGLFNAMIALCCCWRKHLNRNFAYAGCLYPGAPFERKYMAMDILLAVVDTCNMPLESQGISNQCNDSQDGLNPYYRSIFLPSTTQVNE